MDVRIRGKQIILPLVMLILLVIGTKIDARAADNLEVGKDKVWKITFNKKIRYDDGAIGSIKVLDTKGKKVRVRLELADDEKTILVKPPIRGYAEGEKYTLMVERNIYSKFNIRLKDKKEISFTIKNDGPFKDMQILNPEDNINAEENKKYVFNRVDKLLGLEDKDIKQSGWNYTVYKLTNIDTPYVIISNKENAEEIKLPVKFKGWFGVYIGYSSDTEGFKVKHNEKEETVIPYEKDANNSTKYINESFAFADNFDGDSISIVPISGKMAEIAYIKFAALKDEQVKLYNKEDEYTSYSRVVYDNDGYTDFFWGKYPDVPSLQQFPVNLYSKTGAKEINWTLGTTGLLTYNSKYAGIPFKDFYKYESVVRDGDILAKKQIINMLISGQSPLEIVTKKANEMGIKTNASLRMAAFYSSDSTKFLNGALYDNYGDCLQSNGISLSYYYPKFREYILNVLKEVSMTENLDGITLDFCRYPNVMGNEASHAEKIYIMTSFIREVRREIPDKKITVRFPYLNPESYGLDIEAWVKEGLVNRIIPSVISYEDFFNFDRYVEMVKGTNVKLYLGVTANLKGQDLTPETEELMKQGKYIPNNEYVSAEEYLFRAHEAYEKGVKGLFLFNTLNDMDLTKDVYPKFKLIGNKVEVDKWYEFEYPAYLVNYKVEWEV
jgi:hypothetical protein